MNDNHNESQNCCDWQPEKKHTKCHGKRRHYGSNTDAIYGLGVIGALVYFLQHSVGFGGVLLAIVKAFGWPAVVLYKVLELLKL